MAIAEQETTDDAPPTGVRLGGPITFEALVQSLTASKVEAPDGKEHHAYEVTLIAVLPEAIAAMLLAQVREHKLSLRVQEGDDALLTP